jgi:death on curing protein
MIRYLTLAEVLELHRRIIETSGGSYGLRDLGMVQSALAQPQMTFGGSDLYPTLTEKAAALSFSIIKNHPFVDGNKRVGHAAMATFLMLNGCDLIGTVDEQVAVILSVASGEMSRDEWASWVQNHTVPRNGKK